jgi:hypothetical protein
MSRCADLMEIVEEQVAFFLVMEGAAKEGERFLGVAVTGEFVGCEKADKRVFVVEVLSPCRELSGGRSKGG